MIREAYALYHFSVAFAVMCDDVKVVNVIVNEKFLAIK